MQSNDSLPKKGSRPKDEKKIESQSSNFLTNLVLAEMRVQTTILNKILREQKELNKSLMHLREPDDGHPCENATYNGINGQFTLDSLGTTNPNIFARRFLKNRIEPEKLFSSILCPKGKTERTPISKAEVSLLEQALTKYFGVSYSWKSVVLTFSKPASSRPEIVTTNCDQ